MDNFYDTANRMYKSSKILHENGVFHNSCYLGGYVVECYAKIFVDMYSSSTPISFGHNIRNLSSELNDLASNSSLSSYILNGPNDFNTILSMWNPGNLRYSDTSICITSSTISDNFQSEIELVMQKIAKMRLDGLI